MDNRLGSLKEEFSANNSTVQEIRQRYDALFNQARDGIVLFDIKSGQILDCNPEYQKLTGRSLDELKQMKIWATRPPKYQKLAKKRFLEVQKSGFIASNELPYEKPDGQIVYTDFVTSRVTIGGKEYLQGFVRDVTKQKRAEDKKNKV
jgi:PAS domain S-box-containing protein